MTGDTAENHDDMATLHSRIPLVIAVVALLALALLLVAFRSLPIALVSVGSTCCRWARPSAWSR